MLRLIEPAQSSIVATTPDGVKVWPASRRDAGSLIAQYVFPSGSSPLLIPATTRAIRRESVQGFICRVTDFSAGVKALTGTKDSAISRSALSRASWWRFTMRVRVVLFVE